MPEQDPGTLAAQKATGITRGLPEWKERIAEALMAAIDAPLGALGLGDAESRPAQWGELLSAAVPILGSAKALKIGRLAAKAPIKAYHGSPHDFDQFSLSKIGTGEGAQAYGHGLYFAEKEGVAQSYKTNSVVRDGVARAPNAVDRWHVHNLSSDGRSINLFEFPSEEEAKKFLGSSAYKKQAKQFGYASSTIEKSAINPGRMYEVNIHADPEDFLDWDSPLSQQSEKVRQAFSGMSGSRTVPPEGLDMGGGGKILANHNRQVADKPYPYILKTGTAEFGISEKDVERMLGGEAANRTGNQAYTQLTSALGGQTKATEAMRKAGVPGIKYFDGASRGAKEGTRNWVVNDERLIEVVKKYGIAGAVSAGLINQAQAQQLADEGYATSPTVPLSRLAKPR